jgi:hypothetical protein
VKKIVHSTVEVKVRTVTEQDEPGSNARYISDNGSSSLHAGLSHIIRTLVQCGEREEVRETVWHEFAKAGIEFP